MPARSAWPRVNLRYMPGHLWLVARPRPATGHALVPPHPTLPDTRPPRWPPTGLAHRRAPRAPTPRHPRWWPHSRLWLPKRPPSSAPRSLTNRPSRHGPSRVGKLTGCYLSAFLRCLLLNHENLPPSLIGNCCFLFSCYHFGQGKAASPQEFTASSTRHRSTHGIDQPWPR